MKNLDKYSYIIYFLIPISVVIIPLLSGKYIFAFDSIPKNHFDSFYGKMIPIYGGTLFFDFLCSRIINFQKIMIFLILFLSGFSTYYFCQKISMSRASQLYASTLYIFNPFLYIRMISGHWPMLFSYAVLPFLLKTFIDLLEKKEKIEIIRFVFILSIIAFNIHILVISFIIMGIIFLFWYNKNRDIKIFQIIILSVILFIFLNSYWILPVLSAQNTQINNIGEKDYEAFAPKGGLLDIASMYGFWNEGYLYPRDFLPGWQILYLLILSLAILGYIYYSKDQEIGNYVKAFGVVGIVGFILASGVNGPFGHIVRWLFDNTLLKGFRDSHKFVAMMVLAYAVLGGLGLSKIKIVYETYIGPKKIKLLLLAIICISLVTPFVYSFTFFNGFAGQIKPTDYPNDWYEINNYINEDKQDFKILFFPWHGYMDFKWINNTNKRIANPAGYFFDKEVISGTNAEIGDLYREVNTPDQVYIDSLLDKRDNITDFGELISILNVKYVILTSESDYKKYFFLFNQTDLELVKQTKNLYVFKNKRDVIKIYQTDDIDNMGAEKIRLDYT
jgi:hypothetical protein